MGYILGEPTVQQYFDANGDPLENGTIEFFIWNTSTPTAIYSDSTGTSAGTSVTLNSIGAPANGGTAIALFFDTSVIYKIVRKDAAGSAIAPTIGPYYGSGSDILVIDAVDVGAADSLYDYTGTSADQRAQVGGYYTVGDGGGGVFFWNTASVAADDGGITILPTGHTGAGRWVRIYSGPIQVKWFGAVIDGVTDDTAAYVNWRDYLIANSGEYSIQSGDSLLPAGLICDITAANWRGHVIFDKGARIVTNGGGNRTLAFNSASDSSSLVLASNITIGDLTVSFTNASSVSVGDLIWFQNTTTAFTSMASTGKEVNEVESISGNNVTFVKKFLFGYTTVDIQYIYNYFNRNFKLTGFNSVSDNARGLGLSGWKFLVINGFTYQQINRPSQDNGEDGIYMQRCWKSDISNIDVTYARYGIIDHSSYNTVIRNIYALNCRHPVDPNSLAIDTHIFDMTAINCNSSLQSHASIGTTYERFNIFQDRGRTLLRGLQGAIRHGTAEYVGTASNTGECAIMLPESDYEYLKGRFEFTDFTETYENSTTAVPTSIIANADEVMLRDYVSHGFSAGDFANVDRLYMENCRIAFMRGGGRLGTTLVNTVFDPSLNLAGNTTIAWTLNGSQLPGVYAPVILKGCKTEIGYVSFMATDDQFEAAITGASGTGTIATLTFAAITTPYYVGGTIIVSGMTPAGYDGIYTVTASTTTSVSYKSSEAGAFSSGGKVETGSPRMIDSCDIRCSSYIFGSNATEPFYLVSNCSLSGLHFLGAENYVSTSNCTFLDGSAPF